MHKLILSAEKPKAKKKFPLTCKSPNPYFGAQSRIGKKLLVFLTQVCLEQVGVGMLRTSSLQQEGSSAAPSLCKLQPQLLPLSQMLTGSCSGGGVAGGEALGLKPILSWPWARAWALRCMDGLLAGWLLDGGWRTTMGGVGSGLEIGAEEGGGVSRKEESRR